MMGRPIFSYSVLEQPRLPYAKKFPKFFSLQVISKNKLEIIELFGDNQIVKMETPFLQNYWWAGLFFHTAVLEQRLKKYVPKIFIAAELLAKIDWK